MTSGTGDDTGAPPGLERALPPELSATEPPENRGLARDEVRMLVARHRRPIRHTTFRALPDVLLPGDLVVANSSETEAAAVDGHRSDGRPVTLHVSGPAPDGLHVVELRTPDGRRVTDAVAGEAVLLPCGVVANLLTGHPDPRTASCSGLWRARIPVAGGLRPWLSSVGRPVQHSCPREHWPHESSRTLFARTEHEFGSAEMRSAGRPFTDAVLDGLRSRGIGVATVTLHTGVRAAEADETPLPERYRVPSPAVDAVNATRAAGSRIVAVGATVARALETVADPGGYVSTGAGWTHLVLGPERPAHVVRGLLTSWHGPVASRMRLLEAIAGAQLVGRAHAAAIEHRYRWHEFGDTCLLLTA